MGENPKYVFLTGSPSLEEIMNNKITKKADLEKIYGFQFTGNEILLLQHPVTTEIEHSEKQISSILKAIVNLRITTIAIAPNSDAGNKKIFDYLKSYSKKYNFIKFYTTLPRRDFLGMLQNCCIFIGNSSSGIIEASYFRIPVVNIGIRQKGRESGATIFDVKDITIKSIQNMILKAMKTKRSSFTIDKNIYGNGIASKKIVEHLEQIPLNKDLIQKQIFY